ncbi:hypothetical protein [Microvirga roseola]|uniref:hypothetical protein n=1 Tax=Microvirga roseola TaxID=2883126 RepID=UPI001E59FE4E|nr:hypothetical protein [Microvirga roseola]
MHRHSVAMLAAALLAGSSTVALARTGYGGYQAGQGYPAQPYQGQDEYRRQWVPGPVEPMAPNQTNAPNPYSRLWAPGPVEPMAANARGRMSAGQSRYNDRVMLRRQLRQVGFQNIRILDAAFLVQARTPQGRQVVMILSPSGDQAMVTSSVGGMNRSFGGQGQAFGMNQPYGMGQQNRQFGAGQQGQASGMSRQGQQSSMSQSGGGQASDDMQNVGPTVDLRELAARMEQPGLVPRGQVRSYLRQRGFTNISDLSRNGNIYNGTANWFGEQVNLRIDGRNGYVIEPSHMTRGQLRNMLSNNGFSNIRSVELRDTSYRVQASRDGTPVNLWIDARTGEINRQTAANQGG